MGVLAEKGKTTPEYYPMTVAAIVAGCNQKSNRDPITNYDQDDVEETLHSLRKKGAAILVESSGGRVPRWKHTLYDWLKVSKAELAVIVELLLRGPQTEGELRAGPAGWSRCRPCRAPDRPRGPDSARAGCLPFAAGPEAGVMVTHGLYPPEELEKVRQAFAAPAAVGDDEQPARVSTARAELRPRHTPPAWAARSPRCGPKSTSCADGLETLTAEIRELNRHSEPDRMSMPYLGARRAPWTGSRRRFHARQVSIPSRNADRAERASVL